MQPSSEGPRFSYRFFNRYPAFLQRDGSVIIHGLNASKLCNSGTWDEALPGVRNMVVDKDNPSDGIFAAEKEKLVEDSGIVPLFVHCIESIIDRSDDREANLSIITSLMLDSPRYQNREHALILFMRNMERYPQEILANLIDVINDRNRTQIVATSWGKLIPLRSADPRSIEKYLLSAANLYIQIIKGQNPE